ncbi:MAG: deoxyribose-phosphate aldolase [bacterium]|nr:deoxyribose-phosphate aldolase [bacterium]
MNSCMPFDRGLVETIPVNRSAVERRAASLGGRRTFKVESQVAALVRALQCMDLTTLAGDDTPGRVERLCAKARNPVRREILHALGITDPITVGAVCVYYAQVATAVAALRGSGIPVAAVSTDFPDGQNSPHGMKLEQIAAAIDAGATEIDIVISRAHVLTGNWRALYDEIVDFRAACEDRAKLKTILGTGNLAPLALVAKASAVAIMAGADTIKTSTGKEPVNATLPVGLTMVRPMRRFRDEMPEEQRRVVGFKPAGGIRTAKDVMLWMSLMLEELGEAWTKPDRLRIGASGLLTDIERQLDVLASGDPSAYAATNHQPMA